MPNIILMFFQSYALQCCLLGYFEDVRDFSQVQSGSLLTDQYRSELTAHDLFPAVQFKNSERLQYPRFLF